MSRQVTIFDIEESHPHLVPIAKNLAKEYVDYMNSNDNNDAVDYMNIYEQELAALYMDEIKQDESAAS